MRCLILLAAIGMLASCDPAGPAGTGEPDPLLACDLEQEFLMSGGAPRDGIPALSNPPLVAWNQPEAAYLDDADRVVGLLLDGEPVAVPHNILWHHEIVNLDGTTARLAVTYCPLTGSAMVFDRSVLGGGEFRVSGLLYQSNLIMFDRETDSLWPQMLAEARCGPRSGTVIPQRAAWEMTWAGWRAMNPATRVVSSATGHENDYTARSYPYGDYEDLNSDYWFEMPAADRRRAPKERVLGVPGGSGGAAMAFPFLELDELGALAVVEATVNGSDLVVLWDREAQGASAFRPTVGGQPVRVEVRPIGGLGATGFFDQDGTLYGLDGEAKSGPRRGLRLTPVESAYVAFWRAWAAFQDATDVWEN